MKRLIELLQKDEDFRNMFKEYFNAPIRSIISKGKRFNPKQEDLKNINKSLIGHFKSKDFAIAIYKDDKFYCVYIPNIEYYGYIDYTIEKTPYFEIFGYGWEVAELTKTQEDKIWEVIKNYKYEDNSYDEETDF